MLCIIPYSLFYNIFIFSKCKPNFRYVYFALRCYAVGIIKMSQTKIAAISIKTKIMTGAPKTKKLDQLLQCNFAENWSIWMI